MTPATRALQLLLHNRRVVRYSLVACNVLLLVAIGFFTLRGSGAQDVLSRSVLTANETNPIDQLSSAEIAANVAQAAALAETTSVRNNADSVSIELAITPADSLAVAKPQAVATSEASRADIIEYAVKEGEDVAAIAARFNITSDTIIWSNDLRGNNVEAGKVLLIPPINGLIYTVQSGDTPQSLASKYRTNAEQIIAFNDIELTGLQPGERIVIPNAQRPIRVFSGSAGFSPGRAVYGYNGYDRGWCTWYVANRRIEIGKPMPTNLGDAYNWDNAAAALGLPVDSSPRVGDAVVTSQRRPGHVAFVEVVNADGSIWISEMNSRGQVSMTDSRPAGGWNRVDWKFVPAGVAAGYRYIH